MIDWSLQLTQAVEAETGGSPDAGLLGVGLIDTVVLIAVIAIGAHVLVRVLRWLLRRYLESRKSPTRRRKLLTLAHFVTSALIFITYVTACGVILYELNVPLTAYIASATVIGFAVSFGSQSVIQDVINGLTLIVSDLLDVGDLVDIGGQVGVVERVGIRYTKLAVFSGAVVTIPNRNVSNVINYQRGHLRAFLDVRLPADPDAHAECEARVEALVRALAEQFAGLMLREHEAAERIATHAGYALMRFKFRIWPGQGGLIESAVKQAVVSEMKRIDPAYADWMVCVQYRTQNQDLRERLRAS